MRASELVIFGLVVSCASSTPPPAEPDPCGHADDGHEHTGHEPGHHPHAHHGPIDHRFDDPEHWSKVFDDPERDAWQKPEEVVQRLELDPAALVADVGAGTGYFVPHLSRAVPRGKVYAVDIEPKLVEWIRDRAESQGLANVTAVLATPDDPKLPEPVDVVLLVNTYHHIDQRTAYFTRVRNHLRLRGRVVIVDFKMEDMPIGPPKHLRVRPEAVEIEMKAAGYELCDRWDGLPFSHVWTFRTACDATA